MRDKEELLCPNCGAVLGNDMECSYCGALVWNLVDLELHKSTFLRFRRPDGSIALMKAIPTDMHFNVHEEEQIAYADNRVYFDFYSPSYRLNVNFILDSFNYEGEEAKYIVKKENKWKDH